jgi:CDP-paratose 2-epimerase
MSDTVIRTIFNANLLILFKDFNQENLMKRLLVTGSSGLIGSEVCLYFASIGWEIHGVDNNQRAVFFGSQGDPRWNQQRLQNSIKGFVHHEVDIRDRQGVLNLIETLQPDAIVHTAAQPSHDRAAAILFDDFDTNAVGTLNLLEAVRQFCPKSPFVHMSTNKVYGDRPNTIKLKELDTRWDYDDPIYEHGIPETFIKNPRIAEVYNLGGGKQNSCSILEAFNLTEKYSNKAMLSTYVLENRIGDHICYYSDLTKMREHYPHWDITISLEETIK